MLQPRQLEILELMGQQKSNSEIAKILSIGVGTVEGQVNKIFSYFYLEGKIDKLARWKVVEIARELHLIGRDHRD